MKKSTIIATGVMCGSLLLLGCTSPSTPANVSKNLENNLNNLTSVINKLDTIDNSYLSNPDIYPVVENINNNIVSNNLKNNSLVARVNFNDFNLMVPVKTHKNKLANKQKINYLTISEEPINNEPNNFLTTDTLTQENIKEDSLNEYGLNKETPLSNQTTSFYYYDVQPVKYVPRYTNNNSNFINNNHLTNYLDKVKNLYAITSDAIEANTTLTDCKENVLTYCIEIKDLNSAIKDGTYMPNNQQVAAINNYIDDIKLTIKRIKNCNGDLSDEVNNISKTDVGGIIAGIDVISSNYLKVLNHLDTRITYLKNALTTLEQVKQLLLETQDIVNNTENKEIIENQPAENEDMDKNITVETDNNITENESDNEEQNINNDVIEDNNTNNDLEENEELLAPENNDTIINNNNDINNDDNVENTIEERNTYVDSYFNENNENKVENLEDNNSNIDTYLNTNENKNIDTYKPTTNINDDLVLENNNETIIDNNNINQTPINNNDINNGTVTENGANSIINNENDNINAPNGKFQNGIITQNNLNNGANNGYSGNGTSVNNYYNQTQNGNKRTNKNIDTYGYNTMIDMINRGTVNNGINTLSVTETSNTKPSMVSNDVEQCENCTEETMCEDCKTKLNSTDNNNEANNNKLNDNNHGLLENKNNVNAPLNEDFKVELL